MDLDMQSADVCYFCGLECKQRPGLLCPVQPLWPDHYKQWVLDIIEEELKPVPLTYAGVVYAHRARRDAPRDDPKGGRRYSKFDRRKPRSKRLFSLIGRWGFPHRDEH